MSEELIRILHPLKDMESGRTVVIPKCRYTLARTRSLSAEMEEILISFDPVRYADCAADCVNAPHAARSFVGFAHRCFVFHKKQYHVLSRIGVDQADPPGTPVFLIHHIVFKEEECPLGGPVRLLDLPGVMFTNRNRIVSSEFLSKNFVKPAAQEQNGILLFPVGRSLPTWQGHERERSSGASPCPRWQERTGDAGWAGFLAETVRQGREIALIHTPDTSLLPLFEEALELLPERDRWKATLTTHWTDREGGEKPMTSPRWKGVLRGSPEEAFLREENRCFLLDLSRPLPKAPAGELAEHARTGILNEKLFFPIRHDMEKPFFHETEMNAPETSRLEIDTVDMDGIEPEKDISNESRIEIPVASIAPGPNPEGLAAASREKQNDAGLPVPVPPPAVFSNPVPPPLPATTSFSTGTGGDENKNMRRRTGVDSWWDTVAASGSNRFFYSVYVVALVLVLLLFVLLLDQQWKWGLVQALRRTGGTVRQRLARHQTPDDKAMLPRLAMEEQTGHTVPNDAAPDQTLPSTDTGPAGGNISEEPSGLFSEIKKRQEEEEQKHIRREHFLRRREEQLREIDTVLARFVPPGAVTIPIPVLNGETGRIDKPQPSKFPGFSSLFPYGHAIRFDIDPLLPQQDWQLTCEEIEPETSTENQAENQSAVQRFQWSLRGRDPGSEIVHTLGLLSLDSGGLTFDWEPDALFPQNFRQAGHLPFSMLILGAARDGETDVETSTKENRPDIRMPFFAPSSIPAIPLNRFLKESEFEVATVFSMPPWTDVFPEGLPKESLKLHVELRSIGNSGLRGISVVKETALFHELLLISDVIDVRRKDYLGTEITITYQEGHLVFKSLFEQESEKMRSFLLEIDEQAKEKKRGIDEEKRKAFNIGSSSEQSRTIREKEKELERELTVNEELRRGLVHAIEKLPSVRGNVFSNPEIKLDIRLVLQSAQGEEIDLIVTDQGREDESPASN